MHTGFSAVHRHPATGQWGVDESGATTVGFILEPHPTPTVLPHLSQAPHICAHRTLEGPGLIPSHEKPRGASWIRLNFFLLLFPPLSPPLPLLLFFSPPFSPPLSLSLFLTLHLLPRVLGSQLCASMPGYVLSKGRGRSILDFVIRLVAVEFLYDDGGETDGWGLLVS